MVNFTQRIHYSLWTQCIKVYAERAVWEERHSFTIWFCFFIFILRVSLSLFTTLALSLFSVSLIFVSLVYTILQTYSQNINNNQLKDTHRECNWDWWPNAIFLLMKVEINSEKRDDDNCQICMFNELHIRFRG